MGSRKATTTVLRGCTSRATNSKDCWFGNRVSRGTPTTASSTLRTNSRAKVFLIKRRNIKGAKWSLRGAIQQRTKAWQRGIQVRKWLELQGGVPGGQEVWQGHHFQLQWQHRLPRQLLGWYAARRGLHLRPSGEHGEKEMGQRDWCWSTLIDSHPLRQQYLFIHSEILSNPLLSKAVVYLMIAKEAVV